MDGRRSKYVNISQAEETSTICTVPSCINERAKGRAWCERHVAYHVNRRKRLKAEGICSRCVVRPCRPGRIHCDHCIQLRNDTRKARKVAGRCRSCNEPNSSESTLYCDRHLEMTRRSAQARTLRYKERKRQMEEKAHAECAIETEQVESITTTGNPSITDDESGMNTDNTQTTNVVDDQGVIADAARILLMMREGSPS